MQNKLSSSLEDYLEAAYTLCREAGHAKPSAIGRLLGVSKPSVSSAVRALAARGLLQQQRYGSVRLTPAGLAAGAEIAGRHSMLKEFFVSVLGMDPAEAERDACRAEHALSPQALGRLGALGEFLRATRRRAALAAARRSMPGRRP